MSQVRRWCFTLNNYTPEEIAKLQNLSDRVTYIIFGKEIAPTTGTPHLQGYLELKAKTRVGGVKELLGCARVHLVVARGTAEENTTYCSKEATDVYTRGAPYNQDGGETEKERWEEARESAKRGELDAIPAHMYVRCKRAFDEIARESVKRQKAADFSRQDWVVTEWQQRVLDILTGPSDPRSICFLIAPPGYGKSEFIAHVIDFIPKCWHTALCKKGDDMRHLLCKLDYNPTSVVFDCPMATQCSDVDWSFIEELKNGFVVSGKYEGSAMKFNRPTIFFFCNRELWIRDDGEHVIAPDRVVCIKLD